MQTEALEIRNYRLFRDTRLTDLPRLTIVVGANGSGKSTLFDVFSFLKEALTQNVASAVSRRGGFRELVSRGQSGLISITVRFRESGGRLATYQLEIAEDAGHPVVHREILKFRRGQYGKPWHFVDFSRGRGTAITNEAAYGQEGVEADRKEHVLDDPSVLAIKGLGQFKEFRVVAEFRSLIENWHISDFHISDARPSSEAGYAEHLSTRGDNIAQVAQYLYENHRDRFNRVLHIMSERVPGVSRVEAKPTEDGRLVLRFRMAVSEIPSSRTTSRTERSRCSRTSFCSTTQSRIPCLQWRSPRISSIRSYSMSWSKSSVTTPGAAVKCLFRPTLPSFSTEPGLKLTFRTSALDYPRISFGAKLRGAVRYRRSSARWLDAVTERQLP